MRGKYIKEQPVWYQAVLDYPPLPLPPKAPPSRTEYDQQVKSTQTTRPKRYDPKPLPIVYLEDKIRRQFFRDHPFEAFRPTTLVEGGAIEDPNAIQGEAWTRLSQRGRNPTPEEYVHYCAQTMIDLNVLTSAVSFTRNLYEYHKKPLSEAYATAIAQFRALRSEHQIATTFAVMEAEYLGAIFSKGEIEHAFDKEVRRLATFERREEFDEGAIAARKRWKAIIDKTEGVKDWSKGQEYVKLWKAGVRPSYAPRLTQPIEAAPTPERSPDLMKLETTAAVA
ncbi:37S ribosomal protein S25, mitochondrial [Termitomyces sp. J132]|nr:37S ribosomal protein S25, mitochondrial [Termitomyces sp. J132]